MSTQRKKHRRRRRSQASIVSDRYDVRLAKNSSGLPYEDRFKKFLDVAEMANKEEKQEQSEACDSCTA